MKRDLFLVIVILSCITLRAQVSVINLVYPTCPSTCNGLITFSIGGGIPPYTIYINNPTSACTIPTVAPFSTNTITITGFCACSTAYSFIFLDSTTTSLLGLINQFFGPSPITAAFTQTDVCCNGLCNGNLSPSISGGNPPYSYTWAPSQPPGLCAGNYTLYIIDSNGCPETATAQVTQPPAFSVMSTTTAATCGTCCNGGVNAMGMGGQPGYSYTLYPGSLTNTSGTFSNLCPGIYSVCASDAGCCSSCIGVTVPSGSATAIQNVVNQSVNISLVPNPSDGNVKIISQQNISQFSYEIYDIIGNKIISGKATDNININQSADGVYILLVRNTEGEIVSKRKINIKH
jgi:hypothetical protein